MMSQNEVILALSNKLTQIISNFSYLTYTPWPTTVSTLNQMKKKS